MTRISRTYPSLSVRGIPCLIPPEPISASEFETVEELGDLVESQGLPFGLLTKEAWHKYESMLFTPEELQRIA